VFYDYDELTLLTSCNFRRLPAGRDAYDDLGDPQPWFSVADNDIFPEEFRSFLGLDRHLMEVFCSAHEDLFDATWWAAMQLRVAAGEVIDLFPYADAKRLQT
jgi:isocitrate dehydrogenase kinase/phosphatase